MDEEGYANFIARRPYADAPIATSFSLRFIASKQFSCASADNADAKNASNVANSTCAANADKQSAYYASLACIRGQLIQRQKAIK